MASFKQTLQTKKKRWIQRFIPANPMTQPLFIFGCQRSGTNMLLNALNNCPQIDTYNEDDSLAFYDCRLKDLSQIHELIHRSSFQKIVFKPICDSQHAQKICDSFPHAQAIWIVRSFGPVAHSAVTRWGKHQQEVINTIKTNKNKDPLSWRDEKISDKSYSLIEAHTKQNLSDYEGAVLFWTIRNQLYFDQNLNEDKRFLLLSYESFLKNPTKTLELVFRFIQLPFNKKYAQSIHPTPTLSKKTPPLRESIMQVANSMELQLLQQEGIIR